MSDKTHKPPSYNSINISFQSVLQSYGDNEGFIQDEFGNSWYVARHLNSK